MCAWGKFDDRLFLDEKIQQLVFLPGGHAAFTLHVFGLVYAAGELTDGKLTPSATRCAARLANVELDVCVPLLEKVGVWKRRKNGVNWFINAYLKYNPSAAQVRKRRAIGATRIAAWREAKASLDGNGDCNALQRDGSNASVTPPPSRPVPSRPVPDHVSKDHLPQLLVDPPVVPPDRGDRPRKPRRHRPVNPHGAEMMTEVRRRMTELPEA
jgi:hypothetical protein